jgi:predicted nuclease of restriction endonuclease-like RecB superfamily
VGHTREDVEAALDAIAVRAQLKKVRDGLVKLALDACEFSAEAGDDARALRAELFAEAAARRMAASAQSDFSVAATLSDFAARHGTDADALRVRLYADLRGQHELLAGPAMSAHGLLSAYELGQAQAVLLRASEVRVTVSDPHAPTLRYLFHKLKFHGLMHTITPVAGTEVQTTASASAADASATAPAAPPKAKKSAKALAAKTTKRSKVTATTPAPLATRYAITLSGPLSLFQASTKYGLALALVLPALRACAAFELEADVLWGPTRDPLVFTLSGGRSTARDAGGGDAERAGDGDTELDVGPRTASAVTPAERPEVEALLASFDKQDSGWTAARAGEILNVPGLGVCVPDLTFTHTETGQVVHLEVLGFWSRDAVWKRVELVRAGLAAPMIFAVPARLRVSEEVLEDDLPGSLYVFKSVLSRKAILERLEALVR